MKHFSYKAVALLLLIALLCSSVTALADGASKTAEWKDEAKSKVEITIDIPKLDEMPNLFIGSNCNGHTLTVDGIAASIKAMASYNNVEYVLHSLVSIEKSCIDGGRAGKDLYAAGTVAKGGELTSAQKTEITNNMAGGGHNSVMTFARELVARLSAKTYNQIVMEFDNSYIFTGTDVPVSAEDKAILHRAAELLAPYYSDGRVIWITANSSKVSYIVNPPTYVTATGAATPLHQGCYTATLAGMTAGFDLDTAAPVSGMSDKLNKLGLYDKYNMFFGMALFDPQTWLGAVDENGEMIESKIPAWTDYTINSKYVFYENRANIVSYLNDVLVYDSLTVTDTVSPQLTVTASVLEYQNASGEWVAVDGGASFTGNEITASAGSTLIESPLRVRISCDCPHSFHDAHAPADTNVGDAVIHLMYNSSETSRFSLTSPELLKDEKPVIIAGDTEVVIGTSYEDLLETIAATASDAEDGDVTALITVTDDDGYDPETLGEYQLTYSVTDSDGNVTEKTITVTVIENPAAGDSTPLLLLCVVPVLGTVLLFASVRAYRGRQE